MGIIKHDYEKIYKDYLEDETSSLKEFCKSHNKNYVVISRNFVRLGLELNPYKVARKRSDDLLLSIYKEHIEDYVSILALSLKYNIPNITLRRNFKALGLNIHDKLVDGSCKNHGFLDDIDSPIKAYYLGWMFSDGSVGKDLQLSIANEDSYILEMFKEEFGGAIYLSKRRFEHHKDISSFRIPSVQAIKSIRKLGCRSRKSTEGMTYPILNKELQRFFILGFFDGDGSIFKSNRNKIIKFTCTNKMFLESIQQELALNGASGGYFEKVENKTTLYNLKYGNKAAREAIKCYFYDNNSNLYLQRKFNKFNELVIPSQPLE